MLLSACDSKNNKGSQENHLSDKKLSMPAKKEMTAEVYDLPDIHTAEKLKIRR